MIEILLVVLVIVLLLGRQPAWSNVDPVGLLVTVLLIVILVVLLINVVGLVHWRF
jgi:hypothetical protein